MAYVFSFCALLSFVSLGGGAVRPKLDTREVGAPENIIGLRLSMTGMRGPSRSFYLREENGETFFSSSDFGLENVSVPPEYMQKLREIAKKHGFVHMKERDTSRMPFVHDAPMYNTTMYWPDNKRLRLNYWPARDEMEKFFEGLVDAIVNKPGAPEDISSLYYTYMHTNRRNYFRFELHGDDDGENFLFSAFCHMDDIEKVTLRRAPVDLADVQRLREIIKEHGIVNMKGNPVYQGRSAPQPPYMELDIYWPDKKILRLNRLDSGAEELEQFFRDLALANSELWEPTHVMASLQWVTFAYDGADGTGRFMFYLREVSASTQLFAQYVTEDGKQIELRERVDDKHMDQLRDIIKKHGLVDLAKTKEQREKKRSADDPYILNMNWRDDPGLSFIGRPPGGEELEEFFRSLAKEYK